MIEDNYQASTNYVLKIGKFYYRQIVSYKQKEERKKSILSLTSQYCVIGPIHGLPSLSTKKSHLYISGIKMQLPPPFSTHCKWVLQDPSLTLPTHTFFFPKRSESVVDTMIPIRPKFTALRTFASPYSPSPPKS